jgi:hypothetical protein
MTINNLLPTDNKRLKIALFTLGLNFIVFILGVTMKSDLSDLGTGLALLNSPVLMYILGDSIRRSDNNIKEI